ncbi:MAG: DUF2235 domain-containing protein [Pseudomonadota bacterium]
MAAAKRKTKSIVILCDGTSNEIKNERTNVLRLYQCIDNSDETVVFYDPGVGTVGAFSGWTRNWLWIRLKELFGLAFGAGLDRNVLEAYQFLIDTWKEGDRIYLFGFSRGAYTVRVLAGLIYTIGILDKEQAHLKSYALNTIKEASFTGNFENLEIYQSTLKRKEVEIEFLGMWDTVSSVFMWINGMFRIKNIGYSRKNASIKTVRHALAIDERRRFYVHYDWLPDQPFTTLLPNNPDFYDETLPRQDTREVWFAGSHRDSGGGFDDAHSMVPKIAHEWLLREASLSGIKLNEELLDYQLGRTPDEDGKYLSQPDPTAPLHDSLNWFWWIVEFFPKWRRINEYKNHNYRDNWDLISWFNFYIPLGERRTLKNRDASPKDKILIHDSVEIRRNKTGYQPPNLPPKNDIEWVTTAQNLES